MSKLSSNKFIKQIKYRTCRNVYDELRRRLPGFYRRSPSNGLDLTIDYFDNGDGQQLNDERKTILALHGMGDTFQTFTPMIEYFQHKKNVRIIAPNLPTFKHTRQLNYQFWHSSDEKYYLLKDFLLELNINNIDCIVAHSFGAQPVSTLLEKLDENKLIVKSLAMLSPQFMLDRHHNQQKMAKFILTLSKSKILTKLFEQFKLHQSRFIPFKFNEIDHFYHLFTLVLDQQAFLDSRKRVRILQQLQLPGFIMYSTDERIIPKKSRIELFEILNINDDEIIIEQDDPNLINAISMKKMKKIIVKNAGHLPHIKYSNVTNNLIEKLVFNKY